MKRSHLLGLVSSLALASAGLCPRSALALQAPSRAGHPVAGPSVSSGGLEAAPGVDGVRREVSASYGAPPPARRAAWERFLHVAGSRRWEALWDRDTEAPARVFGAGIPAPGTVAHPQVAAHHARAFLAAHLELLAPGALPADFQLVANDLDGGLRTVAFEQYAPLEGGQRVPVIGGRASVRYKNDRLFVFASEAVARTSPLPVPQISPAAAELAAAAWVAEAHQGSALLEAATLVALPLVGGGQRELRAAFRVVIDAHFPTARYAVYVDARSGAPLARDQLLRFSQAQVLFDAPVRGPQGERKLFPARFLNLNVDGAQGQTDTAGAVAWEAGPGAVALSAHGVRAYVQNKAGADATTLLDAVDGSPVSWSLAGDEFGDAQLSGYVHANIVKEHALGIAPAMAFIKSQLPVRVNEADPQGCNAFWDGIAVNFLQANASCHNSARVADVVYHEFGHGFHQYAVIPGAGALDPALGEGTGDTMAASVTHDARLAPGFFVDSDAPLREIDAGRRWPDDISEDPHETGLIWAGALWDLRGYLVADLGPEQGHALTEQLFYQAIRRASNIPTTYAEVLAADDDDGDLSNGTPHVCAINRAFAAHGIASVLDESGLVFHHEPLSLVPAGGKPYPIVVSAERLYPQCASSPIDNVDLRYTVGTVSKQIPLDGDGETYSGVIPSQPAGTAIHYAILTSAGGSTKTLPDNPADDEYSVFAGQTTKLYCNDFETQIDGWTFGDAKGKKGDFQWGAPLGKSGDPAQAFSGEKVLGDRLSGDGAYKHDQTVFADSPVIDLQGRKRVRLQLRRWLAVEDGALDQATIYVNGKQVWQNQGTDEKDGSLTHQDREWRFVDIDLSLVLTDAETTAQIRFELSSDALLQLGGWTIDDLCLVAWEPAVVKLPLQLPEAQPAPAGADPGLLPAGGCACEASGSSPGSGLFLAGLAPLALLAGRRGRRRSGRL